MVHGIAYETLTYPVMLLRDLCARHRHRHSRASIVGGNVRLTSPTKLSRVRWRYNSVRVVLQWCHNGAWHRLCYSRVSDGVTMVLQWCYNGVTMVHGIAYATLAYSMRHAASCPPLRVTVGRFERSVQQSLDE
jgi:hypothetical protein